MEKKTGVDDTISADWYISWKHFNIQLLNFSVAEKSLKYFKSHPPKIISAAIRYWELSSFHFKENLDDTSLERDLLPTNHSLLVFKAWTNLAGLQGLFLKLKWILDIL